MDRQHIGNYRILRFIGQGAMGQVFAAIRDDIERRVAIKLIHPDIAWHPGTVRRLFNEARAVNIIDHPGIVRVSDFGQLDDGTAYLVMEYLDGESLQDRLSTRGRLRGEALRLGRQIAITMAAAHAKDIVHRDLKLANVMIIQDPEALGGERVKILDFGIAKVAALATGGALRGTDPSEVLGTAVYMAPEQWYDPSTVDGQADVYSLGVMLYEMITGRPPFEAANWLLLMMKHIREAPPPLQSLEPAVSGRLAALVHAMLAKSPAERPTMTQAAVALSEMDLTDLAGERTVVVPQADLPIAHDGPDEVTRFMLPALTAPGITEQSARLTVRRRLPVNALVATSAILLILTATVATILTGRHPRPPGAAFDAVEARW